MISLEKIELYTQINLSFWKRFKTSFEKEKEKCIICPRTDNKIEYLGMALGTSIISTVFIGKIVLQVLLNIKEWLNFWIVSLCIMLEACDCSCFWKKFYAEAINIAC